MNGEERKKVAARKRANQVIIRLTDEEVQELNEAMTARGITNKTEFFVEGIKRRKIIIVNDISEICRELKAQGKNSNQALKYYHESSYNRDEIKRAITKCYDLYEVAENILIATENKIRAKGKNAGQREDKKINTGNTGEMEKVKLEAIKESPNMAKANQIRAQYATKKENGAGES